MATEGPGWGIGSIVMITDLASPSGRDHPFPRLAKITSWLDDKHSQAELKMSSGVINRPVGSLVLLVGADEQVPAHGLMFDPAVAADEEIFNGPPVAPAAVTPVTPPTEGQAAGPAQLVTEPMESAPLDMATPTEPTAPTVPTGPTEPTAPTAPTATPMPAEAATVEPTAGEPKELQPALRRSNRERRPRVRFQ